MKRYYRRGHWVTMRRRRGPKNKGWVIAGTAAVVLYLLVSGVGDDDREQRGSPRPAPAAPGHPAAP